MTSQEFLLNTLTENDITESIELKPCIIDDNQKDITSNFSFSIDEFIN